MHYYEVMIFNLKSLAFCK